MNTHELMTTLFDIKAVKFGSFTLKSGILSPIYLDLRIIISYPKLLKKIGDAIWSTIKTCSFDHICGVPYTALPIASYLSVTHDIPMILRRKEIKEYGTKKILEGVFEKGDTCLIIEDVITSGASVLETIDPIQKEGLIVTDVAVIIDREQGGKDRLEQAGLHVHSLFTLTELLTVLVDTHKIDRPTAESVKAFIHNQAAAKK